jgi:hypothetical protein
LAVDGQQRRVLQLSTCIVSLQVVHSALSAYSAVNLLAGAGESTAEIAEHAEVMRMYLSVH